MKVTITISDTPTGVQVTREFQREPDDEEVPMAYVVGRLLCVPEKPKRSIWVDKFFPAIMTGWGVFAIIWLAMSIWKAIF
ncbi:MAG: hypothetical protein NC211_03795 [Alistipes senegalensis]|nr:hypothetical protein [Oxalobacter formigenes]MCM1280941.1 hypothetical protein [Alistipes senegalensis]